MRKGRKQVTMSKQEEKANEKQHRGKNEDKFFFSFKET